jgi:hypothetical protein
LSGEQTVYSLLECRIGLGTSDNPHSFDLCVIGFRKTQKKGRCSLNSSLLPVSQVFADFCGVFSTIETLLEFRHV